MQNFIRQNSDLFDLILNILNLLVFAFIALFIFCSEKKRHKESVKLEIDLNRPTIAFKLNKKADDGKYRIINHGKGTALNIIATYKDKIREKLDEEWREPYLCYSLKEGEERLLSWKQGGHIWLIRYNDIFNNVYFTTCQDDTVNIIQLDSKFKKGNELYFDFEDFVKNNIADRSKIRIIWSLES